MSNITETDQPTDRLLRDIRAAAGQVGDLMNEVIALQEGIRSGAEDAPKESEKRLAELRKWLSRAYELENQYDVRTKGRAGGGAELDLSGARASIGRRLDRLRAARGEGGLSGQSD